MIVGDLLREISRPTKYLLDQGVIVKATITSEHYRISPIFQGGLEIQCVIVRGHLLVERYEQFVKTLLLDLILQKQIFPPSKQWRGSCKEEEK